MNLTHLTPYIMRAMAMIPWQPTYGLECEQGLRIKDQRTYGLESEQGSRCWFIRHIVDMSILDIALIIPLHLNSLLQRRPRTLVQELESLKVQFVGKDRKAEKA